MKRVIGGLSRLLYPGKPESPRAELPSLLREAEVSLGRVTLFSREVEVSLGRVTALS